jgi:hypothetical protein
VALYALVGFIVVPRVAKNLIVDIAQERTGREVTVEEVSCNPFALSLTVRGFSMPDRPGSVLLSFDELYVNAQASSLFRWAATLKELRVTNPYLGIRRFPDGGINLLELKDDIEERMPPDSSSDEGGLPRAVLQHILLTGTAMDVEDLARDEPLRWDFGPSRFELSDISTIPDTEGTNDFLIAMKRGGTIRVNGDVVVDPLGLEGLIVVEGLILENAWSALAPFFKFSLVDGLAGARFRYSVSLTDSGPHARLHEINTRVENLEVTAGSSEATVLRVPAFVLRDGSVEWPEARVRVSEILVEGAEALQWIRDDGTPSWDALVPKPTQEKVVETYKNIEEAFPWDIAVERFEIRDAAARIQDRTFAEPQEFVVDDAVVTLTEFKTGPGQVWGVSASALLPGDGRASADGTVTSGTWEIALDVGLDDLNLSGFQPYVERIAPLDLGAGRVEASGTASVSPGGEGSIAEFAGDLTIHQIDLRETLVDSQILKWGRVDARGINAGIAPMSLEMASLDIDGAGIEVVVSSEGKVNLIELMAFFAERSGAADDSAADAEATAPLPIDVDTVTLVNCLAVYTDRTLTPPFTMAVDPVGGTIEGVSTTATSGAKIDLEGLVRSGGDLYLVGEMDVFEPKKLTDLAIDLRQTEMPPASPMAIRFVGHPLDQGMVDIDLDYRITSSELEGGNRFVIQDLELGERVEGDRVLDLPIKLGVSLLTDKDGRITIEFPIEGNLDDPSFGLGNAITSAIQEITSELVKSPFRMLGKLGGGGGDEDFGFIEFRAGETRLGDSASEKLAATVAGAEQRPGLVLLVEGTYDPEEDELALKQAAFESALADASPESVESLFLKTGSREELRELRAEFEGEGGLDEAAYRRALREATISAQVVDPTAVEALASARAEVIRNFIVEHEGGDTSRVRIVDPVAIEKSDGDGWVRCRLDIEAQN